MVWPKTYDEFIIAETHEWGFDYVDEQFAAGLVPKLVNGTWVWMPAKYVTPPSRNTSTIPHTPVNLIVSVN